jgi:hypothetical protein
VIRGSAVLLLLFASGCSSMGGSAIRTGPTQMPAYNGPVAIYSTGQPPPGAVDLGVVEVHAAQQEATIDELLPQFVKKVAVIGGNVAVVDGIRARFELAARTHLETYYYTGTGAGGCPMGATCAGTRAYAANDELMIVSIFGRAFTTQAQPPPPPGADAPLLPPGPPPAPPSEPPPLTPMDPPPNAPPVPRDPDPGNKP